jgi:ABC-type nitrate/sulfonate/bicarbonate transport system substrate-binding protein
MDQERKLRPALTLFVWMFFFFSAQPASGARVVIGYSTINPRIAPLWIAQEVGYFQKYDLEATLVFLRSTPVLIAGMKSGGMPVAYGVGEAY